MSVASVPYAAYGADAKLGNGVRTRTLVLGLGDTAQSVARWLARHGHSAMFVDSRPDADAGAITDVLPDACVLKGFDEVDIDRFDQLIVSPGIPDTSPLLERARNAGVPILSDIAVFCREAIAPIVCVTGTNGKSTVVSLLSAMCQHANVTSAAGGNLGPPALDLPMLDSEGVYLLELSSFQLQRTDNLIAHSACLLNVSPDHLDWHGSFEHYRNAKERIFNEAAYAVIDADTPTPATIDSDTQVLRFSAHKPAGSRDFGIAEFAGEDHFMFGETPLLPVADSALVGRHNHANVLAALALGSSIDLPMSAMLRAVRSFAGLAHRHQHVATLQGVRWINDSKATNCAAALASVNAGVQQTVLLLGGRSKGEDFVEFARALPDHVVSCVVYGENADEVCDALSQAERACRRVSDLRAAVVHAAAVATSGQTVLLAPASASHDQFLNFAERGTHFCALVQEHVE
ncbi:MAG: UDP-N-acetylmuramoyl-L-alanine--D-glutamate ligase [Pseudomonadota bacterium]